MSLLEYVQKSSKSIEIKLEVLNVRREIKNHETIKNVLKTNFDKNFTLNFVSMCVNNNKVCCVVFVVFIVFYFISGFLFYSKTCATPNHN